MHLAHYADLIPAPSIMGHGPASGLMQWPKCRADSLDHHRHHHRHQDAHLVWEEEAEGGIPVVRLPARIFICFPSNFIAIFILCRRTPYGSLT